LGKTSNAPASYEFLRRFCCLFSSVDSMRGIGGLMDKLRAQARIGATNHGYGRLRNHKTGKDESGAAHGWHDLTNALLSPPAQSEPTGERGLAPSGANLMYHRHNKPAPGLIGDDIDDISGARA
jgi:hypothetical protein